MNSQLPEHGNDAKESQLSADIERLVRSEVEAQVAKEHGLLKDSVGLAAKIVGGAVTLFFAVFTVFGLTTWKDIKQETAEIVKKRAEELIQKADSETGVKNTLNDLLNSTVISSLLATRARGSNREIILANNDWDRLRGWIKKEDLPLQEFADTLAVLNMQSEERKKTDANRLLAEMLNPPETSLHRWITKQPEKTSAILSNFKHMDLGWSAVELISSRALPDTIRGQAAAYVREVKFHEGVEKLLSAYKNLPWDTAKQNALVTCVALRHDRAEVLAELKRLREGEVRREKIDTIADIISLMPSSSLDRLVTKSRAGDEEFQAICKDLILHAATNGLFFQLTYPQSFLRDQIRLADEDDRSSRPAPPATAIQMMLSTSKTSASGVGSLTINEFRKLEAYWTLLSELANGGDIARLRLLLMREGQTNRASVGQNRVRVSISAEDGATVTVVEEGGVKKELDLKTLERAHVASTSTDSFSDPEASISWFDERDAVISARLEGLKGTNYKFSLQQVDVAK